MKIHKVEEKEMVIREKKGMEIHFFEEKANDPKKSCFLFVP